jgi:predicted Zn finger-like uncharacterized protein
VSTIIECPACSTRYKMNKAIPEGGRSVKCARCGHQWRIAPEEPEELSEPLDDEVDQQVAEPRHDPRAAMAGTGGQAESAPAAPQTIGEAWDVKPAQIAAALQPEARPETASPEPQTIGEAWDVRRGNLAAAIASMGMPDPSAEEVEEALRAEALANQPWQNTEPAFRGYDTGTADDETATADEPQDEAREDDEQAFNPPPAPSVWPASSSWMTNAAASDDRPRDMDPESSVRQVLKAAMEDPEERDDAAFDANGGISSVSRPVFTEPTSFEDTLAGVAAEQPDDTGEPWPEDSDSAPFRVKLPAEDEIAADPNPPRVRDQVAAAAFLGSGEESDKAGHSDDFENDIVGIFRQQMQEKRSFGQPAPRKSGSGGFTDYDTEFSGTSSEKADDRYMADSPLDADAATLQAVLEGSLRERHAEEGSSGGGLALAAAWAVFLSVLSGVTLAFVSFRDDMVVALPGTAALYRSIGFDVQDRQVDFGPVTYRWTVAEGKPMIEVTGQIINLTDHEIAVPRVLVNVHDRENSDAVKATATVRSEPLAARETAEFTLEFLSPPKSISQIELAFADVE